MHENAENIGLSAKRRVGRITKEGTRSFFSGTGQAVAGHLNDDRSPGKTESRAEERGAISRKACVIGIPRSGGPEKSVQEG